MFLEKELLEKLQSEAEAVCTMIMRTEQDKTETVGTLHTFGELLKLGVDLLYSHEITSYVISCFPGILT